jgi:hypothetical protein
VTALLYVLAVTIRAVFGITIVEPFFFKLVMSSLSIYSTRDLILTTFSSFAVSVETQFHEVVNLDTLNWVYSACYDIGLYALNGVKWARQKIGGEMFQMVKSTGTSILVQMYPHCSKIVSCALHGLEWVCKEISDVIFQMVESIVRVMIDTVYPQCYSIFSDILKHLMRICYHVYAALSFVFNEIFQSFMFARNPVYPAPRHK